MAYTYSPAGRVEQIDHPDGTRTEQTYDEAGRLETIAHFRSGIREAFYAYDYDLNGNRSSQTEDLGAGEVLTTYDYDRADRLVETERAGRVTTYVLDAVGNRREEIVTEGGLTTTRTFDYNARDQLERIWLDGSLEAEYAYDANGNRIEATTGGVTREFKFGARDRLLSLNVQGSPPEVEWTYDDAGFRIAETTPAEARRFRWDGETMAFETNVLGNLLVRYDHGPDRLLAETEAGGTRTWLTDALKTPVKRLTEAGTTYSVTRYDEYGEVEEETSPDIPRFGFTGHQRGPQEAPDLYYAQQRWYNAATGRFISEDPVWGEPKRPLSLHRYLYAYANPTVFVDPDGRVGIFIDGTWQNKNDPDTIRNHTETNVATLYDLYQGGQKRYIEGVGSTLATRIPCGITGCGFHRRVDRAYQYISEVYNDTTATEADRQIDIFGFSRGAAVSVALVQRLQTEGISVSRTERVYTRQNKWEEVSITERVEPQIRFVGLFDTVSSRGNPATPGTALDLWRSRAAGSPSNPLSVRWGKVGGTVRHAIAAQEVRGAFPAMSLKNCPNCKLPDNVQERYFPGSHGDVGGGAGVREGGSMLSSFSLDYMYREAIAAGVPLEDDQQLRGYLEVMTDVDLFEQLPRLSRDSRYPHEVLVGRSTRQVYYGGGGGTSEEFSIQNLLRRAFQSARKEGVEAIEESKGTGTANSPLED